MTSGMLRLAIGEYDVGWHDPARSLAAIDTLAADAARGGARVLALPETATTGFTMDEARAVSIDAADVRRLREIAARQAIWLVAGVALREGDGRPVNAALAVDPSGAIIAVHRKRRLFAYGEEHAHYEPGDQSTIVTIDGIALGLFICYELRFAELFAPVAPMVSGMICIANWPAARQAHWDVLLRARAIENQCAFVGVNRVGTGNGVAYAGGSAAYDAWGEPLGEAREGSARIVAIDAAQVARVRAKYPFIADRVLAPA